MRGEGERGRRHLGLGGRGEKHGGEASAASASAPRTSATSLRNEQPTSGDDQPPKLPLPVGSGLLGRDLEDHVRVAAVVGRDVEVAVGTLHRTPEPAVVADRHAYVHQLSPLVQLERVQL